MGGKRRVVIQGIVLGALVLTGLLFAAIAYNKGNMQEAGIGFLIAALFGAFAVKFLKDQHENVVKGFPQEDERSTRIKQKAGYYTFLISIYLLLAIGMYSDESAVNPSLPMMRDTSQATGLAIGLMALTFGICWWYFSRKGDVG
ncbi:MAG: DUF2178 domain-containing protein [Candidatus Micrarchaeota archaeon]